MNVRRTLVEMAGIVRIDQIPTHVHVRMDMKVRACGSLSEKIVVHQSGIIASIE